MLKEKIINCSAGIITYGITPPKQDNSHEKVEEITKKHLERLKELEIDALVIYDIQDESERTKDERPFPFIKTLDAEDYSTQYLSELNIPKIIYRCVGKYNEEELTKWINTDTEKDRFSVFVGASSTRQAISMKLDEAYNLTKNLNSKIVLGGVTIPERHIKYGDEHIRLNNKIDNGCKFFISQAIYNIEASKNFLSDYYYYFKNNNLKMVPVLLTLTPCGSIKTLEFMKWLGINIPKWLENDLINSEDILQKSVELLKKQFKELLDFAEEKGIPIGCNIESVSIRKSEIDASILLVKDIKDILDKKN